MRSHPNHDYFNCLYDVIDNTKCISYRKLLQHLHSIEFEFIIPRDANRAADGVDLRYRFGYDRHIGGPCSVFEMMVALALRCEEWIMTDGRYGDRTGQWFWAMIKNLGLASMTDDRFDKEFVNEKIQIFLNRNYEPDGTGGLFTVRNCDCDLRDVEIWTQLLWYLDDIT